MYDYELVCSKCLIHEEFFRFFRTDEDDLVDRCPKCGGTNRTRYADLGWTKKDLARDLKEEWERKEVRRGVLETTLIGYGVMIIAFVILFYCG